MTDTTIDGTARIRYEYLDVLRGLTLISMIMYHALWDLVYIADVDIRWFQGSGAYIWQQSICWTFIFLAGFCWSLGRKKRKRGCIVFAAGMLITLVTLVFMPQQRVVFGVLTLLGSCMLLMIPLEKLLRKVPSVVGVPLMAGCFLLTRNMNNGYLGVGELILLKLPHEWYDCGFIMTYLGFVDRDFYSTDYFSLFPWIFLFLVGYFGYRLATEKGFLNNAVLRKIHNKPLAFVGRNSLFIYLLHQPIIYAVVFVCFLLNT